MYPQNVDESLKLIHHLHEFQAAMAEVTQQPTPSSISLRSAKYQIKDVPGDIDRLIGQISSLGAADTWEQIDETIMWFEQDVAVNSPVVSLQGRHNLRALAALINIFFASFILEPIVVEVTEDLQREHMSIAIIGILHMALYRRWYIPLTWFVSSIPIHVNVKLEVNTQGVFHRISSVVVTFLNLLPWPHFLRLMAGALLASAM